MVKKLHDANSAISKKLYAAVKLRIEERRTDFSGLLQYLMVKAASQELILSQFHLQPNAAN